MALVFKRQVVYKVGVLAHRPGIVRLGGLGAPWDAPRQPPAHHPCRVAGPGGSGAPPGRTARQAVLRAGGRLSRICRAPVLDAAHRHVALRL